MCLFCCSLYLESVDCCNYGKVICVLLRVLCARLCVVYSVVEIVVMSGEVACCSVVCDTLVGVSVFSIMCSELLIMSEIS